MNKTKILFFNLFCEIWFHILFRKLIFNSFSVSLQWLSIALKIFILNSVFVFILKLDIEKKK